MQSCVRMNEDATVTHASAQDPVPVGSAALLIENARLRKALATLSRIQENVAAALLGSDEQLQAGPVHGGVAIDSDAPGFAATEIRSGQADLRASEAALALSRAETREEHADLLASEVALAASQAETRIGLAELLASTVELAASRAETKVSVKELMASAVALSLSRAETRHSDNDLRDRDGQIMTITKNQDLLRSVVEASPTAIILVGPVGQIEMVNAKAERLFGYTRAELHGEKLEVLLPVKFRSGHVKLRTDFLHHMSARVMGEGRELFGLRKDGAQFALEIDLTPIDLGGVPMTLAGVTDITARLAAEAATRARQQQLEKSNGELIRARLRAEQATRAKSQFLAGMSHELRTPLNGILGYAALLDIEGGLTAVQAARVTSMRCAGQHLLAMITSVLDLSEVEAGQITLRPLLINLRDLAQESLTLLRPSADSRGLTLRLNLAEAVPREVVADGTRLRQVLLNLLANAVKFTEKGGVELCFSLVGAASQYVRVLIQIVDTGRGVPPEHRASLFKQFERLGANSAGAVEGAGLGLAISAHLVGLMGGQIVHADNPGGGSVFSFELPLSTVVIADTRKLSSPLSRQAVVKRSAPRPLAPGLAVLVVDDMAMNRDIATSFLRAAGHDAVCVDSGAACVTAVAQKDFDFVLMDLRMPEMDGFEASRLIRGIGGKRGRVPIIALTAHAFSDHIEECGRAGMVGHVSKPFTQATLLAALAQAREAIAVGPVDLPGATGDTTALPIIDVDCFETNMAFLAPGAVATHLASFAVGMEQALCSLDALGENETVGNALSDAVHALTGAIGMFGFVRLVDIGRRFERAARGNSAVSPALAADLAAALEASLREVRLRIDQALNTVAALEPASIGQENVVAKS